MKKLLCAVFALTMLAGCGSSKEEPKVVTCKLEMNQYGVNTSMEVGYEYSEDLVLKQTQVGKLSADSDEVFAQLETEVNKLDFVNKTKGMTGVTYKLTSDKEKREIVEELSVDFEKVSADDYKIVTNGQVDTKGKKLLVSVETTESNMKKAGYTCTK